jgi:hypothetical protein
MSNNRVNRLLDMDTSSGSSLLPDQVSTKPGEVQSGHELKGTVGDSDALSANMDKTVEKEWGLMRKYLSTMLSLILAATIGLSACSEKKPASPPQSAKPEDNTAPAAPAGPAVPAAPAKPAAPGGGPAY